MLSTIPLLSFLLFSVTYPLCFWISHRNPLKNNFHHFHLGLPAVTAGLSLLGMYFCAVPEYIFLLGVSWVLVFLMITYVYWKKPTVNAYVVSLVCVLGGLVYFNTHAALLGDHPPAIFASLLGGMILSAAFYAMNLGHWYLNVHGLPLSHLQGATRVLGGLLFIRLIWDIFVIATGTVFYQGETIALWSFLTRMDGLFVWLAFFFGTLFPFISIYFVWGTLVAKSTQSATGILYVLLSALLIGDIAYKYYLLHFRLPL